MDTDLILIRQMKRGDDAAFDAFVRKYYADILRYCAFHSKSREEAEDLTQETFVRFFAKLSEYRHVGKAKHYLYTIAANLCKNAFAKRAPLTAEEETLEALSERAADAENAATTHLLLEWALGELPPEQRAAQKPRAVQQGGKGKGLHKVGIFRPLVEDGWLRLFAEGLLRVVQQVVGGDAEQPRQRDQLVDLRHRFAALPKRHRLPGDAQLFR